MTLDEYQAAAARFAVNDHPDYDPKQEALCGLAEEVGELLGLFKREARHDGPLDRDRLIAEAGDTLWYLARLLQIYGLSLGSAAAYNLDKLQGRRDRGTLTGSGDDR